MSLEDKKRHTLHFNSLGSTKSLQNRHFGANRPCCTMLEIFLDIYFMKTHSIPLEMRLVSTLAMEAFDGSGLLITLSLCNFIL